MSLKGIQDKLQDTIVKTEDTLILKDEFYTVKEIAQMLKISMQQVRRLLIKYSIEVLNITSDDNIRRGTFRINRSEVIRLRRILTRLIS